LSSDLATQYFNKNAEWMEVTPPMTAKNVNRMELARGSNNANADWREELKNLAYII